MKKLLSMMLMLALVLFYACDEDEGDTATLTPDVAKQEMQDLSTDMTTLLSDMQNSQGMAAMEALMILPDPFAGMTKADSKTSLVPTIYKYMLPRNYKTATKSTAEYGLFDFDAYKGYKYVYTTTPYEYFDPQPIDQDIIIIEFPTEGSTTNDATLTITNYTEAEIYDGYDTWYNPTALDADLKVNDVELVSIDMTATWETTGEFAGEPKTLDVDVYVIPFTFHFDFNHQSTSAAVNGWIEYDGAKVFSVGLTANFATTDFDETPEEISGYVQLYDVKFNATVQAADLEVLMEGQETDPPAITDIEEFEVAFNALIVADVEVNGAKAADISADFTTTATQYSLPISQEDGIYVNIIFTYSDGSSESALPYFASFMAAIDEFITGLDDYYSGF